MDISIAPDGPWCPPRDNILNAGSSAAKKNVLDLWDTDRARKAVSKMFLIRPFLLPGTPLANGDRAIDWITSRDKEKALRDVGIFFQTRITASIALRPGLTCITQTRWIFRLTSIRTLKRRPWWHEATSPNSISDTLKPLNGALKVRALSSYPNINFAL